MLRRLKHSVDALIARSRFERDMHHELRQHLEARTQDLVAAGVPPEDAARRARVEFGAIERYKEQCRDARGFAAMRPFHGLSSDVRLAARRLAATPQFFAFAVLSLAIGIGVTTSVYSVLYSVIWKPIGVADPDRVGVIAAPAPGRTITRTMLSVPDFEEVARGVSGFSAVGASASFSEVLRTPDLTEPLEGEAVSGDYFRAAGVAAALGRVIDRRDDEIGARVVVLNDRTWRARFDGDRGVIGRVVRLGGQPFEIIGVAPRSFDGLERMPRRTAAWVPLRAATTFGRAWESALTSRTRRQLTVIGRLAPRQTPGSVSGELAGVARRLDAEFPFRSLPVGDRPTAVLPRAWVVRGIGDISETDAGMGAFVVALVALVLVVACTNLANLMMARGAERQREIAVRRALGANRWRLVRELLVEAAMVASAGGALALLLVQTLLNLATIELPTPGRMLAIEPELNLPALGIAVGSLLLSLLVFGLEPALQLTRSRVVPDLSGGDSTVGVIRSGRQRAFIRWQVATSVTFFLIAAVLARAVIAQAGHDPGIDLDRLAVAAAYLPPQAWDAARARATMGAIGEQLRQEPGVERVAISSGMPFGFNSSTWATATTADKPFTPNGLFESTLLLASTPDIFRTLGVPIVRGRAFDDRDDGAAPRVVVVSESTARTFFGTTDVLGRRLLTKSWGRDPIETWTVIGVARDTDTGHLMSRNGDTAFVPQAQHHEPLFVIAARGSADPVDLAKLIQKAARRAAPEVALGTAGPASIVLAGAYFAARLAAGFATALGALTLLLAMIGLYGVQGHLVMRRTRELGLRMAMGATRDQIHRMVLREGFRPVIEGLVLGTLVAVLTRATLRAFVNGNIGVLDPAAFALVPVPLLLAAFTACYGPARRASRVDPNEALRHL